MIILEEFYYGNISIKVTINSLEPAVKNFDASCFT